MSRSLLAGLLFLLSFPLSGQTRFDWRADGVSLAGDGGGTLRAEFRYTVISPFVPANEAVVLCPYFRSRDGQHEFCVPSLSVYGGSSYRRADRIRASGSDGERAVSAMTGGLNGCLSAVVPLEPWMDTLDVRVAEFSWSRRHGLVRRGERTVGMLVRTPKPVLPPFSWVPVPPERPSSGTKTVEYFCPLSFDGGSHVLDLEDEYNRENLESFSEAVARFCAARNVRVSKCSLVYYMAPAGDFGGARAISVRRADAVAGYLRGRGAFRTVKPSVSGAGEDWDGVLEWLDGTVVSRTGVLVNLFSTGPDDVRFGRLVRNIPDEYGMLERYCFPDIEGIRFSCTFHLPRLESRKALVEMSGRCPDALSAFDWWRLAEFSNEDREMWSDAVLEGVSRYPDDPALVFDAAYCLLCAGAYDSAAQYVRLLPDGPDRLFADCVLSLARGDAGGYASCLASASSLSARQKAYLSDCAGILDWFTGKSGWNFIPCPEK